MDGLYAAVFGGAVGVVFGLLFPGSVFVYALCGLIVGTISIIGLLSRDIKVGLLLLVIIAGSLGYVRASTAVHQVNRQTKLLTDGVHEKIIGRVVSEPSYISDRQRFVVETENNVRIRVTTRRFPEVLYGEQVIVSGNVTYPKDFQTDTGRVFNYPAFLHKDGITHVSIFPKITSISTPEKLSLRGQLFVFKQWFLDRVGQIIPEPHASLLGGLTVGAQDAMGKDLLNDFRDTGLIHIVVLSGFNVAIVVVAIRRLLYFLPRNIALIGAVMGIVCFALLVGGGATVVRASIMALFGLIAIALPGRRYDITRGLLCAFLIMMFWSPYIVLYDPSFQLSFIATLGLIYLAPWFQAHLRFVPEHLGLREIVSATIATQIFVLPLLLYQSGVMSFSMFIANILVLPVIPITMLGGFIVGVFGVVSLPIGYLTTLLLGYILSVVDIFAHIPVVIVPTLPLWLILSIYFVYFVLMQNTRRT